MEKEEKFIIQGLKYGNKSDFNIVFNKYFHDLCKYGYTVVKDKLAAEEIVEECFYRLWRNRKNIYIKKSLKKYLYSSVHNIAMNYLQHLKVIKKYKDLQININKNKEILYPDFNNSPLQFLINKEFENHLRLSIEQLPEQQKKVFKMNRENGKKYHEIANELNISITTVKSHMSSALHFLRNSLKDYL